MGWKIITSLLILRMSLDMVQKERLITRQHLKQQTKRTLTHMMQLVVFPVGVPAAPAVNNQPVGHRGECYVKDY